MGYDIIVAPFHRKLSSLFAYCMCAGSILYESNKICVAHFDTTIFLYILILLTLITHTPLMSILGQFLFCSKTNWFALSFNSILNSFDMQIFVQIQMNHQITFDFTIWVEYTLRPSMKLQWKKNCNELIGNYQPKWRYYLLFECIQISCNSESVWKHWTKKLITFSCILSSSRYINSSCQHPSMW